MKHTSLSDTVLRGISRVWITAASAASLAAAPALAQVCPFDNGGSSLENDGLVLTRYALGLRGAPLLANTSFAASDAPTVESNIACPACGLRVTDDKDALANPIFTTADATIISRKIAGFSGAALTNGLNLGIGTRNTPASVQSFLLAGCGTTGGTVTSVATGSGLTGGPISTTGTIGLTANQLLPTTACATNQIVKWNGSAWACAADDAGPANAFVQGGNTFSALGAGVASVLGNNDNRPLTIKALQSTIKLLVDPANGDDGLRISYATDGNATFITPNTINGSRVNAVAALTVGATIAGGGSAVPSASSNQVTSIFGTVGGGLGNSAGQYAIVAGGQSNTSSSLWSTVGGGNQSNATAQAATVPGGTLNTAAGQYSFAAGFRANANHDGAFVWGDNTAADVASTAPNQFVVRASGGIRLPGAGENQPGNSAKQSGTNMFTHQVPASGPCGAFGASASRTAIDHPLTNAKPDAILVITPNFGSNSVANAGGNPVFGNPVAVYYEDTGLGGCPAGKWAIYGISGAGTMLANQKFNVLVINP